MVGPYRVDGMLGRGGMATVYEATHESIGRPTALKLLDARLGMREDFVRRFRREGRMQASLEHPHVVAVYEVVESEDGLFIAMQLVRGPTLAALIAAGALTAQRALALLAQIADAIDAAHAAGLVHRDIKPRNVLVGEGDHAYLADFGLTTLGDDTGVTVTGDVLGTVAYLAPEVIRGEPASAASDRYAFAALAFECLTGSVVFPRPTQAAQLYAHTTEPAPRISVRRPELPGAVDALFERALAKDPSDRPASATELVAAIRDAVGDDISRARPTGAAAPAGRRRGGLHRLAGAAGRGEEHPAHAGAARPPAETQGQGGAQDAVAVAALVAAAVAGAGVGAAAFGGDDRVVAAAAAPPLLAGATALGSDLAHAGQTRDCAGRAVRLASADCSILQQRLPGRVIVVPRDGVVRRWAVRSAAGELQLQVLRLRDGAYRQIAVSRSEFVADGQVHAFAADVAVEAGDVLACTSSRARAWGCGPWPARRSSAGFRACAASRSSPGRASADCRASCCCASSTCPAPRNGCRRRSPAPPRPSYPPASSSSAAAHARPGCGRSTCAWSTTAAASPSTCSSATAGSRACRCPTSSPARVRS